MDTRTVIGATLLTVAAMAAGVGVGARAAGSRVEHDGDVVVRQPGPHEGGGTTTAFQFFADIDDLPFVFRKRALHPGSGIGHHQQKDDEVYYVLSGTGHLTLDGKTTTVQAGHAILTRAGSSHALRQTGSEDLVIIITYPHERPAH